MQVVHIRSNVATPPRTAALLALGVLAALSAWVAAVGVQGWEEAVTRWFHGLPDAAGVVLQPAVELGNRAVAVVVALAVAVRYGRRAGVVVLVGSLGAWGVATVVKELVARPRISAVALGETPREVVSGHSYPSSHTAVAFGLAVSLVLAIRPDRRVAGVLAAAAALTGAGRMWLGVHLPLDVAGGALTGALVAIGYVALASSWSARSS